MSNALEDTKPHLECSPSDLPMAYVDLDLSAQQSTLVMVARCLLRHAADFQDEGVNPERPMTTQLAWRTSSRQTLALVERNTSQRGSNGDLSSADMYASIGTLSVSVDEALGEIERLDRVDPTSEPLLSSSASRLLKAELVVPRPNKWPPLLFRFTETSQRGVDAPDLASMEIALQIYDLGMSGYCGAKAGYDEHGRYRVHGKPTAVEAAQLSQSLKIGLASEGFSSERGDWVDLPTHSILMLLGPFACQQAQSL